MISELMSTPNGMCFWTQKNASFFFDHELIMSFPWSDLVQKHAWSEEIRQIINKQTKKTQTCTPHKVVLTTKIKPSV